MNIYLLPGTGKFGGIKVGYQFADLLGELGAPCVVATPDGSAPDWFPASAPTLDQTAALARLGPADTVLFSLPDDYPRAARLPCRKVFHCQGTDPRIDPVPADPEVTLLACWPQARDHLKTKSGREVHEVGIHVSDRFFYRGEPKAPGTVAYMPRRGADLAEACRSALPHLRFVPIDNQSEAGVADLLQACEYYLATSLGEWFGLPAFEAMAAGCVVVSVPTVGGGDYLRDGWNCRVAEPSALARTLAEVSAPEALPVRARLRDHARITAAGLRRTAQRKTVARLLEEGLSFLRS